MFNMKAFLILLPLLILPTSSLPLDAPKLLQRNENNTGLRLRLTSYGLDYANALGEAILETRINEIKLPRIHAKINDGPGYGQVTVENLRIPQFDSPTFDYKLLPTNDIIWFSHGGSVTVVGDWAAWYKTLFNINLDGEVTAHASGINIMLNASSWLSDTDLPQLDVSACTASINYLDLSISGGFIQWVVNLFSHNIATRIQADLEVEICRAAQGVLLEFANHKLASVPTEILIDDAFWLHYGLTSDPLIAENYIQADLKAEITWKGENSTPIAFHGLPPMSKGNHSRMLYFWASDYIFNSFFYSAHEQGMLRFVLHKDLSRKVGVILQTSCEFICLGRMIPKLMAEHPLKHVDIVISSRNAPEVVIQPQKAVLEATAFADVYISPWNETNQLVLSVSMEFGGDLQIRMRGRRITGNLTITHFNVWVIKSLFGEITEEAIQFIEDIAKPILEGVANFHLRKGLQIPTVEGARLIRPHVTLLERAVEIDSDMAYKKYYARNIIKPRAPVKSDTQELLEFL